MSSLNAQVANLHQWLDKTWLRVISLLLGFGHVGIFMWRPDAYAEQIGGFPSGLGLVFVFALCSSMVYGVGFKPRFWLWQIVFSPYIPLTVLSYLTILYVS
ncbi:cyd operon protein YbgE [Vibrio sp. 10N.286.49.C2]|uniref:cyd operon protein YbgE n=1 Tax=unclassified Vibrio TaxID=2614977 RepID=UPI000C854C29|nr:MULTISPECIES: cyd operon protein YbgE [unclassified Vibrio]PMH37717.1 cyd operon protein YbgE [Vibrio sp. 10N.286.49.C2]PMH45118.1 cyd operon protein YbgE [Vibrio sp. 10N.286.49.B1]PMH79075.1 cyd operon protein YbgE [Vibrio sp. 10N.286.48.B7]